ncbi:MAG: ATP-binding domain-containing protein [Desulfobulbaceae bacterium]|nr:ATP-binding domain-containing protein [Desulfobulbaceae bacterium]
MLGQYRICSLDNPAKGKVTVDTVRRFKGLERQVIILSLIEPLKEAELIYVALTRAQLYLIIVGSSIEIENLRSSSVE